MHNEVAGIIYLALLLYLAVYRMTWLSCTYKSWLNSLESLSETPENEQYTATQRTIDLHRGLT